MKKLKWPSAGLYAPDKKGLSLLRKEQIRMVNRQMHERIHLQAHVAQARPALEHLLRHARGAAAQLYHLRPGGGHQLGEEIQFVGDQAGHGAAWQAATGHSGGR